MINSALQKINIKNKDKKRARERLRKCEHKSSLFSRRDTKDYAAKVLCLALIFLPGISNCISSYLPNSLLQSDYPHLAPSNQHNHAHLYLHYFLEVSILIFNLLRLGSDASITKRALLDHAKSQHCVSSALSLTCVLSNIHRISF